jgi:hypothetical protein
MDNKAIQDMVKHYNAAMLALGIYTSTEFNEFAGEGYTVKRSHQAAETLAEVLTKAGYPAHTEAAPYGSVVLDK